MLLNSRQFKFLKNYRNVNVKSSPKREYRDENVFLEGDRALSKLITLLISNKNEFKNFFKSRISDIVLLKLGNLNQNAKRYEARPRRAHSCERSEQIFLIRTLAKVSDRTSFRGNQNYFESFQNLYSSQCQFRKSPRNYFFRGSEGKGTLSWQEGYSILFFFEKRGFNIFNK